jgi:hypothetical protein
MECRAVTHTEPFLNELFPPSINLYPPGLTWRVPLRYTKVPTR